MKLGKVTMAVGKAISALGKLAKVTGKDGILSVPGQRWASLLVTYKLYLGYSGTFNLCKFLMWGGRARKSNEYSSRQPSETQKSSKTYKTSNIQIYLYSVYFMWFYHLVKIF